MMWHKAAACFKENLERFINPKTDPKGFNTNNGLRMMAESSQAMHGEIQALRQEVAHLSTAVQQLQARLPR